MATSFSGRRNRSIRREPPTVGKQLVNFITCSCESSAPFGAPDKLCICVFYAIKTHVLSDQSCTHYADNPVVYINNTFLSLRNSPYLLLFILFEGESVYIGGVSNVCLSKHRCQKRSDWMFTINHPIAVNITNKCGAPSKEWFT